MIDARTNGKCHWKAACPFKRERERETPFARRHWIILEGSIGFGCSARIVRADYVGWKVLAETASYATRLLQDNDPVHLASFRVCPTSFCRLNLFSFLFFFPCLVYLVCSNNRLFLLVWLTLLDSLARKSCRNFCKLARRVESCRV